MSEPSRKPSTQIYLDNQISKIKDAKEKRNQSSAVSERSKWPLFLSFCLVLTLLLSTSTGIQALTNFSPSEVAIASSLKYPYTIDLSPSQFHYYYVQAPEGFSKLAFNVESSVPIHVYVMDQAQLSTFESSQKISGSIFASTGTSIVNVAPLGAAGMYYLVVYNDLSTGDARVDLSFSTLPASSLTPDQLRSAYDVSPILRSGYTGRNVTVAVINTGIDSTFFSDLQGFDSYFGLPNASVTIATPFGSAGTDVETPASETTADVELVHAMAPDARILLVLTGNTTGFSSMLDGFSYVIDHNAADIAMVSPSVWYFPGLTDAQIVQSYSNEYSKSVAENITLVAASNDFGSNNTVQFGNTVPCAGCYLMPQFSPYVTAVGGTNLFVNSSGGYSSETGWDQSSGGPSYVFAQPSWQKGEGVPSNGARDNPDIALDASCSTPYVFFWGGSLGEFCGTSGATPLFSGMIADMVQAAGHRLGFLNPSLYSIASTDSSAFHDVTSGCSLVMDNSTLTDGYCAGKGWDFVTGLGSPDAARLMSDLIAIGKFSVTTPVADRASADVGQKVVFSTSISSVGQGNYSFTWSGLPGCASNDSQSLTCNASLSGSFAVTVTATNPAGRSATSPPLYFVVSSDPKVSTVVTTPGALYAGDRASFHVNVSGGSGNYHYNWVGLPPGCSNSNSQSISCTVSANGTFSLGVYVADSNNYTVFSGASGVVVLSSTTRTSTSSSSSSLASTSHASTLTSPSSSSSSAALSSNTSSSIVSTSATRSSNTSSDQSTTLNASSSTNSSSSSSTTSSASSNVFTSGANYLLYGGIFTLIIAIVLIGFSLSYGKHR